MHIPGFKFDWNSLTVLLTGNDIITGTTFLYPGHLGGIVFDSVSRDALVTVEYESALPATGKCLLNGFQILIVYILQAGPTRFTERLYIT